MRLRKKADGGSQERAQAAIAPKVSPPAITDGSVPLRNAKHEAVVLAYIADQSRVGWRAYASAYPDADQHSAENGFSRLMKNGEILVRVNWLLTAAAQETVMSQQELLEEASKIARANMLNFMRVGADGQPVLDYSNLTHDQAAALSEVVVEEFKDGRSDQREVRRVKFKMVSKLGAIELLMKHYGMMVDKVDHKHDHQHTVLGAILLEIDAESRAARAGGKVIEHQADEAA